MINLENIPKRYIGWSLKRGFYDRREVAAERLSRALEKAGLAHLIDTQSWIRDKPDQLCQGCIFNGDAWQAKIARESQKEARARRWAGRPGPGARKRLNGKPHHL